MTPSSPDPLAELQAQRELHDERHAMLRWICDPENCTDGRWLALCDRLAAAGPTAVECGAWHCSGHRRCELERGHAGRHFTTSLGDQFGGWQDSASTDVPKLLDALTEARAPRDAAEQERDRLAAAGAPICGAIPSQDGPHSAWDIGPAACPVHAAELEIRAETAESLVADNNHAWAAKLVDSERDRDKATAALEAVRELVDTIEMHCPCGARPESTRTHPHNGWCPVAKLKTILAAALAPQPATEGD